MRLGPGLRVTPGPAGVGLVPVAVALGGVNEACAVAVAAPGPGPGGPAAPAAPGVGWYTSVRKCTVCARLLPYVMEANVIALEQRGQTLPYLERFDGVARAVTGKTGVGAANGVAWTKGMGLAVHIPKLSDFGVTSGDFSEIVQKAQKASSMKGNPIPLTDQELVEILHKAL